MFNGFLAVTRFDRSPAGRIHLDDFGQLLGVAPEDKYSRSYFEVTAEMMTMLSLGESAVRQQLRRITVNELLSNPDMPRLRFGIAIVFGSELIFLPTF